MEKLAEKINELAESGWNCKSSDHYRHWLSRVSSVLAVAIDQQAAEDFLSLQVSPTWEWENDRSSQLGHLEGLALKAESNLKNEKSINSKEHAKEIAPIAKTNKIFIVHGHDAEAKEMVARYVQRLKLDPIILHEQASGGKTIIEKFEVFSDVGFAVVLLTPDDVGASIDNQKTLKNRARQNVIMELGYFLGKLGRHRVCALYKSGVEMPSDYQGVVYTELDQAGAWKTKLAQELVEAGFSINLHALIGH